MHIRDLTECCSNWNTVVCSSLCERCRTLKVTKGICLTLIRKKATKRNVFFIMVRNTTQRSRIDHCSHQIQSVSRSDDGSAPRDDLYSPDRQWSLGHIDEPQRQISSEDLVTSTSIGERPPEPVDHLHSDFAAVGTNYWFVWPEGNCPPTEPGFSQGFFSVLSPIEFWFLAAVASGLLSWGLFISSNITDLIEQIIFKLNWAVWCHH